VTSQKLINIVTAIKNLTNQAEFSLSDEDYTNINWLTEIDYEPTVEEIETEITRLENLENVRLQTKASAQAKLAALGLTVEDLQALGL
jgi:DNA-directed RNA polymerase subunit L